MNSLKNLWLCLTTPNESLTRLVCFPFIFLEETVAMLLFTEVLNIKTTRKQKIIYVICSSALAVICSYLIPKPYNNLLSLIAFPILLMVIFKESVMKAIAAEFIQVGITTIFELLIQRILLLFGNASYEACTTIPVLRLSINLVIYLLFYIIYRLVKHYKFNIIFENISGKNKRILIANIIFGLVMIFVQMYLAVYYSNNFPSMIVILNVISLLAYFLISIYSMIKTMKLQKTMENLEQEKLYNKTLQILHDNIRSFKHDFANIIAALGGYIETNDMEGMKRFYSQLLADCSQVSNLSSLNPSVINNPAVYTILANKYYKADTLGIKINLECFIDFNTLNMSIYEFSRILGILLDNAIEATSECEKKLINVYIRNEINRHRQLLIIENTYKDKNVDVERIFEKGFTSKPNNTGLGLWEVNKIVSKHSNLARYTTKNDEFFTQQIEIYEK